MPSLRRRLLLGTAAGTAFVLLAISLCLYLVMRASLIAEFDGALAEKARTLGGFIEQDGERIEPEFAEVEMEEFTRPDRPEFFQIWLADGTVLARSPSLGDGDLDRVAGAPPSLTVRAMELPDGRPGRVASLTVRPRLGDEAAEGTVAGQVTLALARDVVDVNATLSSLRVLLFGASVLGTVLSLGILTGIVRYGLHPVDRLAGDIAQIDETRLSGRINDADAPRELIVVVQRLNGLLQRLQAAFARERSLTADVAHELRTPLAGLRSTLEVALSKSREPEDYRAAMDGCLDICRQTQAMVDNLLALARLDAECIELNRQPVDLIKLLRQTWEALAESAEARGLTTRWNTESEITLATDEAMLRRVAHNILENAVIHADEGGAVDIGCTCSDGEVTIRVQNTGSRIAEAEAERVFERFWRGDAARDRTGIHCGLGLSLSKRIVECLGGSIGAESRMGETFSIAVRLPADHPSAT